jgi:quercetin dioxygenase-like cupin family protein
MSQSFAVFKLEDSEGFDTLEGFMKPLSVSEHVSVIYTTMSPHMKVRPHAHKSNGVVLVLKGSIEFVSNGISFNLTEGSVAIIPANTEVGVNNAGVPTEMIMVSAPPSCKSIEELKARLQSFSKRS